MALASSCADQLATLLDASIVVSPWVVQVGQLTSEPDSLIVFYDTGGQSPNPKWKLDYLAVMIQVRCSPDSYNLGWQKARQIRDFFLGITPQTLPSGDRIDGITMPGDIAAFGYDDQKRPMFSVNLRVIWEPGDTNLTSREPL